MEVPTFFSLPVLKSGFALNPIITSSLRLIQVICDIPPCRTRIHRLSHPKHTMVSSSQPTKFALTSGTLIVALHADHLDSGIIATLRRVPVPDGLNLIFETLEDIEDPSCIEEELSYWASKAHAVILCAESNITVPPSAIPSSLVFVTLSHSFELAKQAGMHFSVPSAFPLALRRVVNVINPQQLLSAIDLDDGSEVRSLLLSEPLYITRPLPNTPNYTLLHYAVSKQRLEALRVILQCGGRNIVNVLNRAPSPLPSPDYGFTPLHLAIQKNALPFVRLLLDYGFANAGVLTHRKPVANALFRESCLELALNLDSHEDSMAMATLLLQERPSLGHIELLRACTLGDVQRIELLFGLGVEVTNDLLREAVERQFDPDVLRRVIANAKAALPSEDE